MSLQGIINSIRQFRSIHRLTGISVVLFFLITGTTGILLGWKKNVDALQPPTLPGSSAALKDWTSFDHIARTAARAVDSVAGRKIDVDRMDVRPDKGMVKVTFKEGFWEAQVDGATGKILSVARRHSDWIEHVHDGSIISEGFKLLYTNYLGLGLLFLSITGFWLWYGPRVVRKAKGS